MKKIIKIGLMWVVAVIMSLCFLKLADEIGKPWINVSWAVAVWFGIETVLFWNVIEEWKKDKLK